jgi:chemotaxis regulatin CheY-phosphate phosphatase CheZ
LFKQKSSVDEIYEIFERCGVLKKELDEWLKEIELDRPSTEKAITDLFFLLFYKKGIQQKACITFV